MKFRKCYAVVVVLALSATGLWAAAAGEDDSAATTEREMIRNARGEMQEKPQYGGSINVAVAQVPSSWDPAEEIPGLGFPTYERLGIGAWAGDRETCLRFVNVWFPPIECMVAGMLAESWEQPDPETIVLRLRQGVRWHDIPPVNGREFVADDVVYTLRRHYGAGAGEGSPAVQWVNINNISSVEARDKYTVVVKSTPNPELLHDLLVNAHNQEIVAREAVEEFGTLADWETQIGTGAWIAGERVEGSTQSYVRNPDYWGTDELFPAEGFQLPYADGYTIFEVPELSTAIAALRSGQVDKLGGATGFHETNLDQQKTLAAQEPDLLFAPVSSGGNGVMFPFNKEPWYPDIRVRQAMQKAINIEELAATHYGGVPDPIPRAFVYGGSEPDAYSTPWSQKPEAVREGYTYDPQGARELLAEAGYPDGFKVNLLTGPGDHIFSGSPDLAVIVKSYWEAIGLEVEIEQLPDNDAFFARIAPSGGIGAQEYEAQMFWTNHPCCPQAVLEWFKASTTWNPGWIDDPAYEQMFEEIQAVTTREAHTALVVKMNDYVFDQQWFVTLLPVNTFIAWHPWLKSYNGENQLGRNMVGPVWARVWVDQDLKQSMGF
jgi:peptide/nickel transport system substrate-binding protein